MNAKWSTVLVVTIMGLCALSIVRTQESSAQSLIAGGDLQQIEIGQRQKVVNSMKRKQALYQSIAIVVGVGGFVVAKKLSQRKSKK